MFQLTANFSTIEGLQDAVLKLSGAGSDQLSLPIGTSKVVAPTKAAEKKAAAAVATTAPLAAPATPAAVKGKAPAKAKAKATSYSIDELKAHVLEFVDASNGEAIKAFARSRGVAKYGDMSEEQIQEAYAAVEEYFTTGEGAPEDAAEPDPMD